MKKKIQCPPTVNTLPSTLPTPKVLSPGLAAPVQVSCKRILNVSNGHSNSFSGMKIVLTSKL